MNKKAIIFGCAIGASLLAVAWKAKRKLEAQLAIVSLIASIEFITILLLVEYLLLRK